MNKKYTKFIIGGSVLLAIIILIIVYHNVTKIDKNSSSTTGNTPGNLLNGGSFCESGGKIYFSNPYDNNKLYSMDSDCSNIKCLTDDDVSYINCAGRYIYYVKNNAKASNTNSLLRGELYGVVRCALNGGRYTTLHTGYSTDLALSGNTLIFNGVLNSKNVTYAINVNGKNEEVLLEDDIANSSVYKGHIYYSKPSSSGTADHSVYSMRVSDGSSISYLNGNTYMASVVNNVLYYIDLDNNYALTSVNLSDNTKKVLTTDKVVLYNVYNDVIYYQEETYDHSFNRMNKDGSNQIKIYNGDITSISCTSKYTFFKMFGSDTLYRVETNGDTAIQKFFVAAD